MSVINEKIVTESGVELITEKRESDDYIEITMHMSINRECILHWGFLHQKKGEWNAPDPSFWPPNSEKHNAAAVQTHFTRDNDESNIIIKLQKDIKFSGLVFVLFFPEENQWDNNRGKNYHIRLQSHEQKPLDSTQAVKENSENLYDLNNCFREIIDAETGHNSWTLMHRFNLCYNLLDRARDDINGLAVIYVWLRFSAIRQLDWQRNYNTQPRELSHSQDRLTLKLTDIYINSNTENRELIRLIVTTLGRGGEGQRIRDDILNIMHRHHIKEVSGHFMEEWHQKLHNNTTPDDIVICHAYLEFLKSNGDLERFYKTLEDGGVTKERLANFERPITTPPDFVPHLKDALIYDFENYLRLLKSIHSGTDLESSINTARSLFDEDTINLLDNVLYYRDENKQSAVNLVGMIIEARRRLAVRLNRDRDNHCVRSFLYLDLALEEFLRVVVERNIHFHFEGDQLVELIGTATENLQLSHNEEGLVDCFNHWGKLKQLPRFGHDWSLHARSILDRLERLTGDFIDRFYQLFQSRAELLGNSLNIDSWAITLFSEEAVRGQPAFVLSQLIRQIDPLLRKSANLGNWQIISRGGGKGQLEIIDNLQSIQRKTYDNPTVIIADRVMGDEEIPENVKAVITPDVTDIVSHVAVRARNAHILFATCYDTDTINHLKSLNDRFVNFEADVTGNVIFEEYSIKTDIKSSDQPLTVTPKLPLTAEPDFVEYAISEKYFKEKIVGGKSINIARLRKRMPAWILVPHSVAMPFGVFEKILNSDSNREITRRYNELVDRLEEGNEPEETLAALHKNILELNAESELLLCLQGVMKDAMVAWPENLHNAWTCIKRVWASKWNERAYLSRKTNKIPHNRLFMAVLIQQVVNADYAFVIHTVNPFSNDKGELYAEIVPGLGETLVSNYPGRALSFTANKISREPKLLSFPSKSVGIYGHGIIFRSDSNGEDLPGYAGAGLYDSVTLEPTCEKKLNYANEAMVMDEDFRNTLLGNICKIGVEVENAFEGTPQDIEGVFSQGRYYVVQTRRQVGV